MLESGGANEKAVEPGRFFECLDRSHKFASARHQLSAKDTVMARTGLFNLPDHWIFLFLRLIRVNWRHAMLAGLVASSFPAQSPVHADEFDVLAVYSDARPLNDEWQVCAASFVRHRLRSSETPEMLAKAAFDQCLAAEHGLTQFLMAKIGRESAEIVMAILRDKYLSGLGAAIIELRSRS